MSVCGSARSPGVLGVRGVLVSPWLVGLGVHSLSVSDCCTAVLFFLQKASSLPHGQSRRCEQGSPEDGPPLSRRRTHEVDCGVDQRWAAVYHSVARRILSNLDHSEVLKVNTGDLEHHVLAPNEPDVDMKHIVMQATGEKHQRLFQVFSRQGRDRSFAKRLSK